VSFLLPRCAAHSSALGYVNKTLFVQLFICRMFGHHSSAHSRIIQLSHWQPQDVADHDAHSNRRSGIYRFGPGCRRRHDLH